MKTEREKRLEAALRDIARGPLQGPPNFANYAQNRAQAALSDEGSGGDDTGSWTTLDPANRDTRPQRGGWAPGTYYCVCKTGCGRHFIGDKRAVTCADCAYEGAGGGADHSRDFEGSDPRGMGPLPGEPGNPNPSFEQMENGTPPQRRDALKALERLARSAPLSAENANDTATIRRDLTEPAVPEAVLRLPEWMRRQWDDCRPETARVANTCAGALEDALAQHGLDSEGRCHKCGGTGKIGAGESKKPCPDCAQHGEGRAPDRMGVVDALKRGGWIRTQDRAEAFSSGWNECRKAMLAAAPEPDWERNDGY